MKAAKLAVVACLLSTWMFPAIPTAEAAPPVSPQPGTDQAVTTTGVLGNDISWPQCDGDLPAPPGFAVVGVNGGRPDTTNPCLARQLNWAGASGATPGAPVALYVNTANPGPAGPWWWPRSNAYGGADIHNPYGTCDGTATAACAYIYGYAMAFDDVNLRGVADAAARLWWLDVETGNSWSHHRAANAADLEGMTAYLQGIGAEVGIYSTTYQFGIIAGRIRTGSNLNGLKSWIPGAASPASARATCSTSPLTAGGTVALTQFTAGALDYDYPCIPAPAPAPVPAPAPAAAPIPVPATVPTHQAPPSVGNTWRPKPGRLVPQMMM